VSKLFCYERVEPHNKSVALIVDDGESIRSLIAEMLADAGFEVLEFQTAEAALASAPSANPTLVLTDLRLGKNRMTGAELLREIALILPGTQGILMSAAFDPDLMPSYRFPLLAKPFSRTELLSLISPPAA